MKALYGSWIFDLFGVDNEKYEEYMKTRINNSPKHVAVSSFITLLGPKNYESRCFNHENCSEENQFVVVVFYHFIC